MSTERVDPKVLLGVFLISVASLALQVLQMRIFAWSLWHHLAFLVISIAILGFGAAGAFLSVAGKLREANLGRSIAVCGLMFTATAFIGPLLIADKPVDVFQQIGWKQIGDTALFYLVFALPYFFAGYVISIALTQQARSVSKLYFVNMLGSGVGCFVLYALLVPLGAAGSLVVIASIGTLIAILAPCGFVLRGAGVLGLLACLSILPVINQHVAPLVNPLLAKLPKLDGKDQEQHPHKLHSADKIFDFQAVNSKLIRSWTHGAMPQPVLETRWSPLGRIDIVNDPTNGAEVDGKFEPGAHLFQDGDAPGRMPHRDHPVSPGEIHAISYVVKKQPNVLIVGLGGGLDVHVARKLGAKKITGVEINPQSFELLTERFKELTGSPTDQPNIDLHCAEGRNFIRGTDQKFDLIQMSGVDTYTALANGAYVLSESYLYTKEAFHDYLDHLEDDGMLTMIRFSWPKPREMLRAMVIAMTVLGEREVAEPHRHIAVLIHERKQAETTLGALLVKKSPFTDDEIASLRTHASATAVKYTTDYLPGDEATANGSVANPFHDFVRSFKAGKVDEFFAGYEFKIDPVTDDAPFFFNQHSWSSVWDWMWAEKTERPKLDQPQWVAQLEDFQKRPMGLMLLGLTLAQLAVLALVFIFGPLFLVRRSLAGGSVKAPLGYFVCLGLAYIFLMISAMQRFSLVLGHPTYSITITMATFLIASGLGSLVSGKWPLRRAPILVWIVALLLVGSAYLFHFELPKLSDELLAMTFTMRALCTIGMLAPIAFLMGMCFPTGIRLLAETRQNLIPWAYGINGVASVIGSVLTVCLAMALGFTMVHWIAAGFYVLAALLIIPMARAGAGAATIES